MRMDKFFFVLFVRSGIILVIVCSGFRSLNSEVENVNEACQSASNDCVLTRHEKWVLKSYFYAYRTLDDGFFQSFKEKEFTPCVCEVDEDNPGNALKLSGLERHLVGEGSHRRLLTSIRMDMQDGSKDQLRMESCEVIIIERLPAGVFADPFELQHLHELGVYSDVAVFGDTNLELPSFLSNRSAVEIHVDLAFENASILNNSLQIDIEIPLHTRYPALSKSGYSSVQFGECDVLVRCSPKSNLQRNPCLSIFMTDAADKPAIGRLLWKVPSGIETHAGIAPMKSPLRRNLIIFMLSAFHSAYQSISFTTIKLCKEDSSTDSQILLILALKSPTNGGSEKFVNYQVLSPKDLAKSVLSEGGWSNLLCSRNKKEQPTDVALVFVGRELRSLDISSGKHGDSALVELLKVSFETSNSSVAFPYVAITDEETMEASLISGFKEACGQELEATSVAFFESCSLETDNHHKDHLSSHKEKRNKGNADLILFCHDTDTSSDPVLESEVLSELVLSVEKVGRKLSVLYVSNPCGIVEYPYSLKLARILAESASGNASVNSTCQGVCQVKSTLLEGVFVGVVLLVILISGLGCMMGIQTPSRFEAPQDS